AYVSRVAELAALISRMRREAAEQVRSQHRRHHRAVAAARLAADPPVRGRGEGRVAGVDERDDLVAEIRVVVADAGRVEELRAAVRRPRVDEDDERRRAALVGEE